MSESLQSPSVLVISNDLEVVEAIIGNSSTEHTFNARESVQQVLSEPALLKGNGIIIYDIATADNVVDTAIDQAIKLKQADPTQVLMVVGDKEPLNDILKSYIQPMVYRAFNKPISSNQIFLAFNSANTLHAELEAKQAAGEDISFVGPQENRTNVNTLAEQRKTNPAIYAAIGVAVVAVLGWLFFGGSHNDVQEEQVVSAPQQIEAPVEADESDDIAKLNELNQLASNALFDGRFISPKGDNALEYFDQALILDPYDPTAYDGRKAVAVGLRDSYKDLVRRAKFDEALGVVNALAKIEPLNPENDGLQQNLQDSITAHVKKIRSKGTSNDELAKTAKVLAKIESATGSSSTASDALRAEQDLITKIQASLDANNLVPPQKGNAYSLLSSSLKSSKISRGNSDPLIKKLSSKLIALAKSNLAKDDLQEASKISALVKRIQVDNKGLASLNKQIRDRRTALSSEAENAERAAAELAKAEAEAAKPKPARIIPAKIISREPPRYPSRALQKNVEGWVELMFVIDQKGKPANITVVSAEPLEVFDSAAVKSVKKWRFSPARNQETGLPVQSARIVTKVQFRLN